MVLGLKPMGKSTTYQNQVLDRIKVLHSPRTQTYGKTNYLSKSNFGQNQGIAWSCGEVSYLRGILSRSILKPNTRKG